MLSGVGVLCCIGISCQDLGCRVQDLGCRASSLEFAALATVALQCKTCARLVNA